jgi:phage-related minor tail protein
MLDFVTRPIRQIFGGTEQEIVETVHETHDIERDMLGAVEAIEHATSSIERHVEVIESLATSVDPLRASVDRLTDTMQELVAVLGPLASAEHEAQKVGRLFHRHHDESPPPES